jgi:predicted O-methyltransferase YrrM
MKWEQDLVNDIRTFTAHDDLDAASWMASSVEVSDCNFAVAKSKILSLKNNCKAILEIGISRNGMNSITQAFLQNKLDSTIYVGIDLDDKTYLDDKDKNIFTIRNNSSAYEENIAKFAEFGVDKFDLIFIDGWHSINQVLDDWEYTNLLSDDGIVGFHDINAHPGPYQFLSAIDTNKWNVERYCPNDWGIGFVSRKK